MNDTNNLENNQANQPPQPTPPHAPTSSVPIAPNTQTPHVIQPSPPTPTEPIPAPAVPAAPTQPTPTATAPTHHAPVETPSHPAIPQQKSTKKPFSFKRWYRKHSGLVSLAQLILGPILLVIIINLYVFQPYQVFGSSMTPTLAEGDRLIINKLGKSWSKIAPGKHIPKRGDIIVFHTNLRDEIQLIKRVIGLPGEKVVVKDGIITVYNKEFPNGFNPDEAWNDTLPKIRTGNTTVTLGDNELFVSGDNRLSGGSLDSRNDLGPIQLDSVVGELIFRMFPLNSAEVF